METAPKASPKKMSQNVTINVDGAARLIEIVYRPNMSIRPESCVIPFHLLKSVVGQIIAQEGGLESGGNTRVNVQEPATVVGT